MDKIHSSDQSELKQFFISLENSYESHDLKELIDQVSQINKFKTQDDKFNVYEFDNLKTLIRKIEKSVLSVTRSIKPISETQKQIENLTLQLQYLASLNQFCSTLLVTFDVVKVTNAKIFLSLVLQISLESLSVCKDHENELNQKSYVEESISLLYNKCQGLLSTFSIMVQSLQADSLDENEVEATIKISEAIFQIIKMTSKIDVKLMSTVWKTHIKLLSDNQNVLKDKLDVASIIDFLYGEIECSLKIIDQGNEEKAILRAIKLSNFYLKIIVLICDKYCGYLGDCYSSIFSLFIALIRSCPPNERSLNLSEPLKEEIMRCLNTGIEPLISHLITDRGFIDYVLSKEIKSHHTSVCLFYTYLIPHIISTDVETQESWFAKQFESSGYGNYFSIIQLIFQILPQCETDLKTPLYLPGIMHNGKAQKLVSLYEYICSILCGFLAALPASYFNHIENELFVILLSENIFQNLLASDMICFIARYGSAELCFSYCVKLANILKEFEVSTNFYCLLSRLIKFLADSDKKKFLDNFPVNGNEKLWRKLDFADFISIFTLEESRKLKSKYLLDIKNWIHNKNSSELFCEMIKSVDSLRRIAKCSNLIQSKNYLKMHDDEIKKLNSAILSLWNLVNSSVVKNEKMASEFLVPLIGLTSCCISTLPSLFLLKIMKFLKIILHDNPPSNVSFTVVALLREFISFKNKSSETCQILQEVAECFLLCLCDENCLVREAALEAFEAYAHNSAEEEVVKSCVRRNDCVQKMMTQFLKGVPHDVHSNFTPIKKILFDICESKEIEESIQKSQPKKLKLDYGNGLESIVMELKSNVSKLKKLLRTDSELPVSLSKELMNISRDLNKILCHD